METIFKDGYLFPILLSSIVFFALCLLTLRHRYASGSYYFVAMLALLSLQGLFSIFELQAAGLENKLQWRNLQQIPLYYSPVLMLCVIMAFVGLERKVISRWFAALSGIVATYMILIFLDSDLHLIRKTVMLETYEGSERIQMTRTLLGMGYFVFVKLLGLWVLWLLGNSARKVVGTQRTMHLLVMLGILSPFCLPELAGLFGLKVNVAVSMLPSGLLLYYALYRLHFLQVTPIAREKILEHMKEGILIVDNKDMIIDANPAALEIVRRFRDTPRLKGMDMPDLLSDYATLRALYGAMEQGEVEVERDGRHLSVSLIPVYAHGKRTGAITIFTDITERKKYENELIERSTRDGLTMLYNRRHFLDLLESRMRECEAAGTPISLLLIDLDHFKRINDEYGHLTGDRVLAHFASVLTEELGERGIAGRIGGEEFAVALPEVGGELALEFAERLRLRLQEHPFDARAAGLAGDLIYTISIGVAERDLAESSLDAWYHRADNSLYGSKHGGRDRSTLAG